MAEIAIAAGLRNSASVLSELKLPRAKPLPFSDGELRARRDRFQKEAVTLSEAAYKLACEHDGQPMPAAVRREYESLMNRARYRKARIAAITTALKDGEAENLSASMMGLARRPDHRVLGGPVAATKFTAHEDGSISIEEIGASDYFATERPRRSWWSRLLSWLRGA